MSPTADDPRRVRYFIGDQWIVNRDDNPDADIEVYISGAQYGEGLVLRSVKVKVPGSDDPDDDLLTIDQARQLAAALTEAADEADKMESYDQIEVTR